MAEKILCPSCGADITPLMAHVLDSVNATKAETLAAIAELKSSMKPETPAPAPAPAPALPVPEPKKGGPLW